MPFIHALKTNRKIKIPFYVLSFILVFLSVLPFFVQWGLEYELKQRGATEVSIDDININFFTGEFELKQVQIKFNQQPNLSVNRVFIAVSMGDLFQSTVVVNALLIDALNLQIKRNDNGSFVINGYALPASDEAKPDNKNDAKNAEPLRFSLQSAQITNSTVNYAETGFNQQLRVSDVSIKNMVSWDAESIAHIVIALEERHTKISADLSAQLFAEEKTLTGTLTVNELQTKTYQKFYLPFIDKLHANIDLAFNINLAYQDDIKGELIHNISMSAFDSHYQQIQYTAKSITLSGKTKLNGQKAIVDASLVLENSHLLGELESLTVKQLDLALNSELDFSAGFVADISHKLKMNGVDAQLPQLEYAFERLQSNGKTKLNANKVAINTTLSIDKNRLNSKEITGPKNVALKAINLTIEGDLDFNDVLKGTLKHQLHLAKLSTDMQQLRYQAEKMTTRGKTKLSDGKISVDAELVIEKSHLLDLESQLLLNSLSRLSIEKLYYDENKLSFDDLTLSQFMLLENAEKVKLLSLKQVSLKQFDYNLQSPSIQLALVDLQQPDIFATLSEQKQLTHLSILEPILKRFSSTTAEPKVGEKNEAVKPRLKINVAKIQLSKPGKLHFNDLSVQPNYSTDMRFNKIEIDQLSSEHAAGFSLALKQGDYTTIDINGKGLLFNPQQDIHYVVDIKQLDLPPVSAYTTQAMGYGIKSGVVDSVIKGSIKQQQIDSNIVLKIDSIEVVETNKETAQEITGASGMSIDLALSTLKDSNNIIDLELPIGGDIEKPDFDLSLIINKAMGIAMKAASISYLKYALQPFSSVVSLFNLVSDAANSISLAPVTFQVNSGEWVEKQTELLDKVNNILNDRPGIKIKACGFASLEDQQAIQHTLIEQQKETYLAEIKGKKITKKAQQIALSQITAKKSAVHQAMKILADKRSAAVKTYLTQVKKVDATRVLNCLSAENLKEDSKPVVELLI